MSDQFVKDGQLFQQIFKKQISFLTYFMQTLLQRWPYAHLSQFYPRTHYILVVLMKSNTVLLVTLLAVAAVSGTSTAPHAYLPNVFEAGELEFSSENVVQIGNQHTVKHYLHPQWKKGAFKVLIALKKLISKGPDDSSALQFSGWELNMIQNAQDYQLELIVKEQLNFWTARISFLRIGKHLLESLIIRENLMLRQGTSIKTINEDWIMTVGGQAASKKELNQDGSLIPMVFLQGLSAKPGLGRIKAMVSMSLSLLNEGHLHLDLQWKRVESVKLTILVFNKTELKTLKWRIELQTINIYGISDEIQYKQMSSRSFYGLNSIDGSYCEGLNGQEKPCQIKLGYEKLIIEEITCPSGWKWMSDTESCIQVKKSLSELQYEQNSLQMRFLHNTCHATSISCPSSLAHATVCYKTDKCKILIVDCGVGYYANSYLCSSCTACSLSNCVDCTKLNYVSLVCTNCATGFYLTSAGTCVTCPNTCATCSLIAGTSTVNCLTCKATYTPKVTSGVTSCVCTSTQYQNPSPLSCITCSTTSTGCKKCTYSVPIICSVCLTGFYLTAPTCTACMPVCYNCTTATTCGACVNNLVLNASGVCECSGGTLLDPVTKTCVACSTLQANCLACSYNTFYNPAAPTNVVCSSPAPGYFILPSGATSPCIQYCQVCADATTCTTPYPTFSYDSVTHTCYCDATLATPLYLNAAGTSCSPCISSIPGCLACVNVTVTKCNDCTGTGFYSAGPYPVATCSPCPSTCITCTSSSSCGTCQPTFVKVGGVGVCQCDTGSQYFLNPATNQCALCSTLFTSCATCTDTPSLKCTSCINNFYPSADGLTCLPCSPLCNTCNNPTTCIQCMSGYTTEASGACTCAGACATCITASSGACPVCTTGPLNCITCSPGYYDNTVTCVTCPTALHCQQCSNAPACLTCISPFVMSAAGCVCNATAGQYLTLAGTGCNTCSDASVIPNCATCSYDGFSTTICTLCSNGYYSVPATYKSCQLCTGNCATCVTSSSNCLTCLPTYDSITATTCACSAALSKFYDPLTGGCSLCSSLFVNCVTCIPNSPNATDTLCSDCSAPYYPAANGKSCLLCPSECKDCTNYATCTLCTSNLVLSNTVLGWTTPGLCVCNNQTNPDIFLDTDTGACLVCSQLIVGCTSCSSNGTAIVCGSCIAGTYLNTASNTCVNCDPSCATCSSSATNCLSCSLGLTLNKGSCVCTLSCYNCQTASPNCISCSLQPDGSILTCATCTAGSYLSSPDCFSCPATCATCTSDTTCLTCQPTFTLIGSMCSCNALTNEFQSGGICMTCSNIFYGCTKCEFDGAITTCVECQPGYFVSAGSCAPCSSSCSECSIAANNCTACLTGYNLVGNVCVCSTCATCTTVPNCASCVFTILAVFSQCKSCAMGYYLDSVTHLCVICPTTCLTCGTGGACLTCASTYEVIAGICQCDVASGYLLNNQTGQCLSCGVAYPNCQTCIYSSASLNNITCATCAYRYYLVGSTCTASVCGDGLITSGQTCDDGNVVGMDGCSNFCKIENNYNCSGTPSVCYISMDYSITPQSVVVQSDACNQIHFSFLMHPVYDSYNSANFDRMFVQTDNEVLIKTSTTYKNGVVTYYFNYTDTIEPSSIAFTFMPPYLGVTQSQLIPLLVVNFPMTANNNIAPVYYEPTVCSTKESIQKAVKIAEYTSYAILIVSALPAKIVGLELFGVLQLAFFSVGNMDNVNTLMASMMHMTWVNGLNLNVDDKEKTRKDSRLLQSSALTPNRVQSIGYASNFLRNCNLMFLLVTAVIGVAFVLFGLSYLCKKCAPSLFSISRRLFKEVLLTLILFNCYNFAYSAGLHFYYAVTEDPLYTLGTVAASATLIIPTLMAVALMCSEEDGFGEYKDKLKDGAVEKGYFVATILYRTGMGLYVATMNEDELSTLIVMAMSILWLLYNLVNLPFRKAYHNYRANICHLTQFVCLFVTLYYRSMMSTTNVKAAAIIFTPVYIQLTCILLSLLVSLIVLVYEVYIFIKNCLKSDKQNSKIKQNESDSLQQDKRVISLQNVPSPNEKEPKNIQLFSLKDSSLIQ